MLGFVSLLMRRGTVQWRGPVRSWSELTLADIILET